MILTPISACHCSYEGSSVRKERGVERRCRQCDDRIEFIDGDAESGVHNATEEAAGVSLILIGSWNHSKVRKSIDDETVWRTGVRVEWNYIDTSIACVQTHTQFYKILAASPSLSSDEKIFPSIKTSRDALGYFFDYLNWTTSTKNLPHPNRFVSFFSFSLSPSNAIRNEIRASF